MAPSSPVVFFFKILITFVFHAPLELDDHHLSREVVQEGLRVDWDRRLFVDFVFDKKKNRAKRVSS